MKIKDSNEMSKSLIKHFENSLGKVNTCKTYINQVSQEPLDIIYKGPYFNRFSKIVISGSNENSGLIKEEYSMKFLNLMGYTYADIDELLLKFMKSEIQRNFYTLNYLNNINCMGRKS